MTDIAALQAAADKAVPPIVFPGNTPIEQMTNGYAEATKAVFKYAPSGSVPNFDIAKSAISIIGSNIEQNGDAIAAQLEQGKELYDAIAWKLGAEQARQYVLAQYATAEAGIGAYFTGDSQGAVANGIITQAQHDDGIALRMRVFSNIVLMDQDNKLEPLLRIEEVPEKVMAATPSGAAALKTGIVPANAIVTIRNRSIGVQIPNRTSAGGLGLTGVELAVLAVVLVAITVTAGIVVYYLNKKQLEINAETMKQVCADAAKTNNPALVKACVSNMPDMGKSPWQDTINTVIMWGAIGLGVFVAIQFMPQIIASFGRATDVYQERQHQKRMKELKA